MPQLRHLGSHLNTHHSPSKEIKPESLERVQSQVCCRNRRWCGRRVHLFLGTIYFSLRCATRGTAGTVVLHGDMARNRSAQLQWAKPLETPLVIERNTYSRDLQTAAHGTPAQQLHTPRLNFATFFKKPAYTIQFASLRDSNDN